MRQRGMVAAIALTLFLPTARAERAAPTACQLAVDEHGKLDVACLPALAADGTRVAVPERCDERRGPPCLAIAFLASDGKVRERIEVAQRSVMAARVRRVNQLLADGRFVAMTALELPFSAHDLNVMTLRAGGVVLRYGGGTLAVDRDDRRLATLELPSLRVCTGPWIRSLLLDERTHTLVVEFEYHDRAGCSAPPSGWRVVRF